MKYQIVTNRARQSQVFQTGNPIAAFRERGFELTGIENGTHLRQELRGEPRFEGLCGPMWGGVDASGDAVIRYEDWESYELLSS